MSIGWEALMLSETATHTYIRKIYRATAKCLNIKNDNQPTPRSNDYHWRVDMFVCLIVHIFRMVHHQYIFFLSFSWSPVSLTNFSIGFILLFRKCSFHFLFIWDSWFGHEPLVANWIAYIYVVVIRFKQCDNLMCTEVESWRNWQS